MKDVRNKFFISRPSTTSILWNIVTQGDLIVVPTDEMATEMREMFRTMGGVCLRDLVKDDPEISMDDARNRSVEVLTQAELDALEAAT